MNIKPNLSESAGYGIRAFFSAKDRPALYATAKSLEEARYKAQHLKSEGYLVEIRDGDGQLFPVRTDH